MVIFATISIYRIYKIFKDKQKSKLDIVDSEANTYKIINEICEEKSINQKLLSYGWIRELKKENKK